MKPEFLSQLIAAQEKVSPPVFLAQIETQPCGSKGDSDYDLSPLLMHRTRVLVQTSRHFVIANPTG